MATISLVITRQIKLTWSFPQPKTLKEDIDLRSVQHFANLKRHYLTILPIIIWVALEIHEKPH